MILLCVKYCPQTSRQPRCFLSFTLRFCCISWPGEKAPGSHPTRKTAAPCLAGVHSFPILFSVAKLLEKSQHKKLSSLPLSWLLDRKCRELYLWRRLSGHTEYMYLGFCFSNRNKKLETASRHYPF